MGHDGADLWDSRSTLSKVLFWWRICTMKRIGGPDGDTDWFKIEHGMRQGCVISPGLYNIYSEHIMLCVLEEHHDGITIGDGRETNLRCADDTTLLCTSKCPSQVTRHSMSNQQIFGHFSMDDSFEIWHTCRMFFETNIPGYANF